MNPLLISGFGTSITVDKGRLIINNKDKRLEFYPHQIEYDSIIIDGHTGNISFEGCQWRFIIPRFGRDRIPQINPATFWYHGTKKSAQC